MEAPENFNIARLLGRDSEGKYPVVLFIGGDPSLQQCVGDWIAAAGAAIQSFNLASFERGTRRAVLEACNERANIVIVTTDTCIDISPAIRTQAKCAVIVQGQTDLNLKKSYQYFCHDSLPYNEYEDMYMRYVSSGNHYMVISDQGLVYVLDYLEDQTAMPPKGHARIAHFTVQ